MQKRTNQKFTREERLLIVQEFENTSISRDALAQKYGIKNGATISTWKKRLENVKKSVHLQHRQITEQQPASKVCTVQQEERMDNVEYKSEAEEILALREALAQKDKALKWERDRNLALETLIEIAEEQGMPVKKCGAKQ